MNIKRGSAVIIIAVIAALIFFIVAASVGGYFAYKYYFAEEEEEEDDKESKSSSEKNLRDEEGFVDCGESSSSLEDFDDPFFNIDFDQDKAFVCMGENLNNNCSKAKSSIDVEGMDLLFKVEGSNSFNCKARFEAQEPGEELVWAECPISVLMSFAREQAVNVKEFGQIIDKMEQGEGDHAASIFALMAITLNFDLTSFRQLGCDRSE